MGLFNKLFGDKTKADNPDNTKLLDLLGKYWKENFKGDSYKNVAMELMNGNSFLMFPTKNNFQIHETDNWTTTDKETTLKMASLFNMDGLKVLGAFTDEQSMLNWTKKPSEYTAMRSKDILKFAQDNGIERIVINSDQPNMFVVERSRENVKTHSIKKDTKIQLGQPAKPLSISIIEKLIINFENDKTISEVYQYGQTKDGEFSIVLGFKLTTNSDNAKTAAINTVQNAIQGEILELALDLFFIETESWYDSVRKIDNSLLYKR